MPQVASKASVLKSQHPGLSQRERTPEARDTTSPFSILLAEAGSNDPAPPRQPSPRVGGGSITQRSDGQRDATQRNDAIPRPEQTETESAADAPEACTSEATATEQPEDATAPFELAVAAQLTATPALPEQPGETTTDEPAADDAVVTVDAALAAVVEAPVAPAQPVIPDTGTLPRAAPVVVPPAAPAPADNGTPAPEIAASFGAAAPARAEGAAGAAAPAADIPPAPRPTDQSAQQAAANAPAPALPDPKQARPAADTSVADETANPSQTTSLESAVPAATAPEQQAGTKSEPPKPAHAGTHSHASGRQNTPDGPERPQTTGSTVSDFVQATHPTPDSSHVAHLQSGREFGQSVAATAQAAHAANASNPLVSAPIPLESLAVEIATRAQGGSSRFEIRLDPPELGRIDVRLDIDRSGNVTSRLVVEKAETLDVLRRDAHQLERALQDAGLKTSDNSLQFSLRDQSFTGRNDQGGSNNQRLLIADPELPAAEGATAAYGLSMRGNGGIDIRV
ncbi:MAG: flagellar hook-length control protein FliK [Xanthobacteraceae bacterium]|nr:flagellar hook-length control protein FliK [Xanthobacteraceae bacterium]